MSGRRRHAFVTLLTSNHYLPGALTLVSSLTDVERDRDLFDTVCIVTVPNVSHDAVAALHRSFDVVVGVDTILSPSTANLELLGRKDLSESLTKLHVFRLTQYERVIFLDADTLVLKPLSHLFTSVPDPVPLAACPDVAWPDAFNSGMLVAKPSDETFKGLCELMVESGSWDGGDQGLLNDFFPNWHRLPFIYNVTPTAYYTYAPAFRRYGNDVAVLHFIGDSKPWARSLRSNSAHSGGNGAGSSLDYHGLVHAWFDVFERHFGLINTYEVMYRVYDPPSSFKPHRADFISLPPAEMPQPKSAPASQPAPPPVIAEPPPMAAPVPQHSRVPSIAIQSPSPKPAHVRPASPPKLDWDPARSSPPRESHMQMRQQIDTHYGNAWEQPRQNSQRFEPPPSYPTPPPSTHEWYKDVMKNPPDASAVKPVFPWESVDSTPKRSFDQPAPSSEPAQAPITPQPELASMSRMAQFTNAWDDVPGINKYARFVERRFGGGNGKSSPKTPPKSPGLTGPSRGGGGGHHRKSSSTTSWAGKAPEQGRASATAVASSASGGSSASQPPPVGGPHVPRSDTSSRDGDDEDGDDEADDGYGSDHGADEGDDDDDSEERWREPIKFRKKKSASDSSPHRPQPPPAPEQPLPSHLRKHRASTSGETSPRTSPKTSPVLSSRPLPGAGMEAMGGRTGSQGSSLRPGVPSAGLQLRTSPRMGTAPLPTSPGRAPAPPSPGGRPSFGAGGLGSPRSPGEAWRQSAGPPSPGANARLASQALRNATASRLQTTTGFGDGPAVHRASRVFAPETDTNLVKREGLAALERFVRDMETEKHARTSGSPNQ